MNYGQFLRPRASDKERELVAVLLEIRNREEAEARAKADGEDDEGRPQRGIFAAPIPFRVMFRKKIPAVPTPPGPARPAPGNVAWLTCFAAGLILGWSLCMIFLG